MLKSGLLTIRICHAKHPRRGNPRRHGGKERAREELASRLWMCMWVACQASRAECLTTAGPSFRHTGISSYPPDCMGYPQPGNRFPPFRWPSQEGLTMDLSTLQSCKAMSARFPFRTRRTRSRSFMNRIVSPAHSRHSPHVSPCLRGECLGSPAFAAAGKSGARGQSTSLVVQLVNR